MLQWLPALTVLDWPQSFVWYSLLIQFSQYPYCVVQLSGPRFICSIWLYDGEHGLLSILSCILLSKLQYGLPLFTQFGVVLQLLPALIVLLLPQPSVWYSLLIQFSQYPYCVTQLGTQHGWFGGAVAYVTPSSVIHWFPVKHGLLFCLIV